MTERVFVVRHYSSNYSPIVGVAASRQGAEAIIDREVNVTTSGERRKRPRRITPDEWGTYPGQHKITEHEVAP